jgi:hypothetical protein
MELDMYFTHLFQIFISIIQFFKNIFFKKNNYYIKSVNFIYTRDDERDIEDITREYRKNGAVNIIKDKAQEVTEFLFKIEYFYNSKTYIFLTKNPEHVFPPKREMRFTLQVTEASMLDSYGVPLFSMIEHIKKYEGPHFDFHGETILLSDLIYTEIKSPKLRLTNVLGTTVEYDIETDSINHQTLWLPGKT